MAHPIDPQNFWGSFTSARRPRRPGLPRHHRPGLCRIGASDPRRVRLWHYPACLRPAYRGSGRPASAPAAPAATPLPASLQTASLGLPVRPWMGPRPLCRPGCLNRICIPPPPSPSRPYTLRPRIVSLDCPAPGGPGAGLEIDPRSVWGGHSDPLCPSRGSTRDCGRAGAPALESRGLI